MPSDFVKRGERGERRGSPSNVRLDFAFSLRSLRSLRLNPFFIIRWYQKLEGQCFKWYCQAIRDEC